MIGDPLTYKDKYGNTEINTDAVIELLLSFGVIAVSIAVFCVIFILTC